VHSEVSRLAAGKYLLVTSYRKDGTAVPTPVWVVLDGDRLAVWTPAESYKVRRIRRDPRVRLAPCTMRGEATGPEVTGTAAVLVGEDAERIRRLIVRRYGVLGWLTVKASQLRRGRDATVGIAFSVDG
jgi:PPOX class probable F420-dependent enzyme